VPEAAAAAAPSAGAIVQEHCRSCGGELAVFLSLGDMPLPDALLRPEQLGLPEPRYPLDVAFCPSCSLVQIQQDVPPERLFVDNYLYFSSFSTGLVRHSAEHARRLVAERGLGPESLVVEIASNDGYLLRNFVEAGIPVLGIDPAPEQAAAANALGVPTLTEFFDADLARRLRAEGKRADVIVVANNVMAHTPTLNSFVEGLSILLADDGIVTIENTYVKDLIDHCEFDTIYHEHFCYFSCSAVDALARRHGLYLNGVEHFPALQGGTLRWRLGTRAAPDRSVAEYLEAERRSGLTSVDYYREFATGVQTIKRELRELLASLRADGKTIAAYGAAAKGSTLVNFVGIGPETVDYVVDRNVHKQGLLMPGTHLPIRDPSALLETMPDFLLLLAWNYKDEIAEQQAEYLGRGGRFIVPVPRPEIL
jgi:SAM-dependent methyltransferase